MASYRPIIRDDYRRSKPWKAKVKRNNVEYFLGYFATKEEAVAVETKFKAENP